MCGAMHSRSMWMVEMHLKFLKGLVRQRARLEGSMMEGYMVYQNMMYIIEYLLILASKLNFGRICDLESNNNFKGEYLFWKCRPRKVKVNYYLVENNYSTFNCCFLCIYHTHFIFNIQYASIKSVYYMHVK